MIAEPDIDGECLQTTDGDIAVINLHSARQRLWTRFFQDPLRDGIAETILEHEQLTTQFVGDLSALDRLESLATHLAEIGTPSVRSTLIQAHVASTLHRFADARRYLTQADHGGAPQADVSSLLLTIDQACGANLGRVLEQRREIARKSRRLADLVALAAVWADLREFTEADHTYRQALREYRDVSPFPVAWICFQLGMLWGELVPEPQPTHAAQWYRRAVECLPRYVKARVHLAEIYSSSGRTNEAEALLLPALTSGDPEVSWRLADVLASQKKSAEAEAQMQAARYGFESLLERHLLAFADHGAEFYAGSGNDPGKALDLARVNVANRPTLRAFEQAHATAVHASDVDAASELLANAKKSWGGTAAFRLSPLANREFEDWEGAAA